MGVESKGPADLARRLGAQARRPGAGASADSLRAMTAWRRETFKLPREAARAKAREWFRAFPQAAYLTEIEFWRETDDGDIEFTIRRLPSAD